MSEAISTMANQGWFGVLGEWAEDEMVGKPKAEKAAAENAAQKVKEEANQKALLAKSIEEDTTRKKQALLAAPTSGFGPNTNLARSFLTTL